MIVDRQGVLLHTSGDLNAFIDFPQGIVKMDVKKILKREVASYVSSGLYKSEKDKLETNYRGVSYTDHGQEKRVDISVIPLADPNSETFYAILFSQSAKEEGASQYASGAAPTHLFEQERIRELEDELRISNENLQATIEELETSNEELQSTNEELQSVNEELYTVNSEHQAKIDILTNLNADINNLLRHTEVSVLYLDQNLNIKLFTPNISLFIDLIEGDIGRSIFHFSFNESQKTIIDAITSAKENQKVQSLEFGEGGDAFRVVARPYYNDSIASGGVIVTFLPMQLQTKETSNP